MCSRLEKVKVIFHKKNLCLLCSAKNLKVRINPLVFLLSCKGTLDNIVCASPKYAKTLHFDLLLKQEKNKERLKWEACGHIPTAQGNEAASRLIRKAHSH